MTKRRSSRPATSEWMRRALALIGLIAALPLAACNPVALPRAEFTTTPTVDYPPLHVALDGSASTSPNGPILSYAWDLGDGQTATGPTLTHTYSQKGTYAITLVVTDSAGKSGARTHSVQALNRVPVPSFTFSPYWVGANAPVTFDASESHDPDGMIVQYIWAFGDGTTGEGMIVEHEYTQPGWKPLVTLTVIDEDGGAKSTSKRVNIVGCPSCG